MKDVESLVRDLGIPAAPEGHHHKTPNRVQIDCPFCSPHSGKFRLGIHSFTLAVNCWVCGSHRLWETLAQASGAAVRDVGAACVGLVRHEGVAEAPAAGKLALPGRVGPLLPVHRKYLRKRGYDPDAVAAEWGVGGIGMAVKLAWRLFIPVHLEGRIVSWTTRSLSKTGTRYSSAPPDKEEVPHKTLLYGGDKCGHAVIVCEGPLDAWKVGPGGIATFGVAYTPAQVIALSRFPVRYVCFDNEPDGRHAAAKLVEELLIFPGETYNVTLETGKDPSRASAAELEQLRRMIA